MKAIFKGDKDTYVFEPIQKTKRGRPKKNVPDIKVGKTNADHIRSMTDEELAVMFAMLKVELTRLDRPVRPYHGRDVNDNYDWLKQPYKEEA